MQLAALLLSAAIATAEPEDVSKLSEALGHLIGKNIDQLGLSLDLKALAKGMEDEASGKQSPLNAEDCTQQLQALQEKKLRDLATQNLAQAVAFLSQNKQKPGIHQLSDGKLQYKVEKEGNGDPVESYHSPLVRFNAKYLNGKAFGESSEEMPISLSESIPGFRLGLLGMKQGEIRTLYVHPELAYGSDGQTEPNALLIFEVEVLQLNGASSEDPLDPAAPSNLR